MTCTVTDLIFLLSLITLTGISVYGRTGLCVLAGTGMSMLIAGSCFLGHHPWQGDWTTVGICALYLCGLWGVTVVTLIPTGHFLREKRQYKSEINRLKRIKTAYDDHTQWLTHEVSSLREGYQKQLALTEMLRSMSRTLAFTDVFAIFARTVQKIMPFEQCDLVFIAYDNNEPRVTCQAGYPAGERQLDESLTRQISIRDTAADSCRVRPLSDTITVVDLCPLNNVYPALIFSGMPIQSIEEIRPLIAHVYLELRKSYLFDRVKELSLTDALTGCYLRRYFLHCLNDELARIADNPSPFAVMMLDIDRFKQLNDRYGHLPGDYVLRETAQIIRATLRKNDICARYGGEEFAFLLPGTDRTGALSMAKRLRDTVTAHTFSIPGVTVSITVSIGVAVYPQDGASAQSLIDHADARMYQAKHKP